MLSNEILPKFCSKFFCEICDYSTCKKSSYDDHLLSTKHQKSMVCKQNSNPNLPNSAPQKYTCQNCNKEYKDNSGLWRHKNKGVCANKIFIEKEYTKKNEEVTELKEIMKYLMKENSEMKNMMIEVIKNGTHNNNITNTTHTNSHNKAFNLNFFLNETCKDAMNIGEFVDSLKLQLSDLEKVGEAGYIEGISSIIVKNLKALDVTKRPVHCTDKKRETVYIKDADKWEKDEDKTQMHKLVKKVVSQNVKMFAKFREAHPDCKQYHSKYSDQYNKIIYESMGGKGDDDFEKNEKIIKNVLKEVVVDKNI
jgi:hypothetical protein